MLLFDSISNNDCLIVMLSADINVIGETSRPKKLLNHTRNIGRSDQMNMKPLPLIQVYN